MPRYVSDKMWSRKKPTVVQRIKQRRTAKTAKVVSRAKAMTKAQRP